MSPSLAWFSTADATFRHDSRDDSREQEEEQRDIRTHANALTLVTLLLGDLLGDVLYLQQQLDALDGRDGGLGDRRGDTAGDEILGKRHGIRESRHRWVGACVSVITGNVKERERERRLLISLSASDARRTTSERGSDLASRANGPSAKNSRAGHVYQSAQLRNRRVACASPTCGIPPSHGTRVTLPPESRDPTFFHGRFSWRRAAVTFRTTARFASSANSAFESRPFSRLRDVPSGRERPIAAATAVAGIRNFELPPMAGKLTLECARNISRSSIVRFD